MSKIKIEITRVDVKTFGNHFIAVLLEQETFPERLINKEQYRTNIESDTEFPVFIKNIFEFSDIILGNKITLKFGLFSTKVNESYSGSNKDLFSLSNLIGAANLLFTVSFIEKLRKHKYIDMLLTFFHPEKEKVETGKVAFRLTYKADKLDVRIFDDNKDIEAIYYDPFEEDRIVIKEKLVDVINMNEEKQYELKKTFQELDQVNNNLKKVAFDLNNTRMEFNKLEKDNTLMAKRLDKLQNVDELHIELDILNSDEGLEIIKKKYAILVSQIALQGEITMKYDNEYKQIENLMTKIRMVKERTKLLKEANNELKFNIMRERDLVPLVSKYIEKSKANDSIIHSLHKSLEEINKVEPHSLASTEKRLDDLYKQRRRIEEKKLQMDLHQELFSKDDRSWEDNFIKIIGNDMMMNDMFNERERFWIEQFRKKKIELEGIVKELSQNLAKMQKQNEAEVENTIVIDPGIRRRVAELKSKIEAAEKREQILFHEVDVSVMFNKSTISKLKDKIEEADKYIDKEVQFAKRNYYKMNDYTSDKY